MNYDAIVVGAGPAGSTAARILAQEGASVLLLDRSSFPRDKPCGGGVTLRAASVQELDLTPVVERTVFGARFSLRLGPSFDRRFGEPLAYMTRRSHLDTYLARAATEAGVAFHDGDAVRGLEIAPPNGGSGSALTPAVTVRTAAGTYTADVLLGADGANGIVGRAAAIFPDFDEAVALEGNAPLSTEMETRWQEILGLDLGGLAGGFGWLFPKGDHLNVGVGCWKYAAFTLRPKLSELCRRYGVDPEGLNGLRGHHLPLRVPGTPITRGPVALMGDAAGLIDPLSGEGIHNAFASGRLAAETALSYLAAREPDLSAYQRAVDLELQPDLTVSRQLQELFHFAPPPFVAVMRQSQAFWHSFCYLIRGETTYADFASSIGPLRLAMTFFATVAQRRRLSRLSKLAAL